MVVDLRFSSAMRKTILAARSVSKVAVVADGAFSITHGLMMLR